MRQAEAVARTVVRSAARLATKGDMDRLEAAAGKDIAGPGIEWTAARDEKFAESLAEIAALRAAARVGPARQTNGMAASMVAGLGLPFAAFRFAG